MSAVQKMVLLPFDKFQKLLNSHSRESTDARQTEPPAKHTAIEVSTPTDIDSRLTTDLIMSGISKQYKTKARALLHYLDSSDLIHWKDNGEISVNNRTVHKSHIADLIKYAMRDYGQAEPVGLQEFRKVLSEINVPKNLVGNPQVFDTAIRLNPPGLLAHPLKKTAKKVRGIKWISV